MIWTPIRLLHRDGRITQAWNKLMRKIQRSFEVLPAHNPGSELPMGTLVVLYNDGSNTPGAVRPAARNVDFDWTGVVEPAIASGSDGLVRFANRAYVLLDAGLTVAPGTQIFVSTTPGIGTDAQVGAPIDIYVGEVMNTGDYSPAAPPGTTGAVVLLRYCCQFPGP